MVIDNEFINGVIQQIDKRTLSKSENFFGKIKFGIPSLVRKLLFSGLNPFYVYYFYFLERKRRKIEYKNTYVRFSIDFVLYCLNHNLEFDLAQYYPSTDHEALVKYVRNRVKSCFNTVLYKKEFYQEEIFYSKIGKEKLIKRKGLSGYSWKLGTCEYLIPHTPESSLWRYNLGLDVLPALIKESLKGKSILDVGAFWGDTSLLMLQYNPKEVWSFEPEEKNFQLLLKTIGNNKLEGIIKPVKLGISNNDSHAYISSAGGVSTLVEEGNQQVEIKTIDTFVKDKCIEVGLIKMDIEGNEYNAIIGAEETIKKFKPLLIVSLYHTGKDFFEIPPLLKTWNPDYHFRFIDLAADDLNEKMLLAF